MKDISSYICVLYVDLFIGSSQSLKEKRMVLKSFKDRIRARFNVSIAEVDGHDKWQASTLGFTMIGTDSRYIDKVMQNILSLIDSYHTVDICTHQVEFL